LHLKEFAPLAQSDDEDEFDDDEDDEESIDYQGC
jgi:hypothetical protein